MTERSTPVVLVPGGGGAAAVGAIKSLRQGGFTGPIVSSDADPLSPGLFLANRHYVLPPISDPSFFDRALEMIDKERISVIFPTSGFDTLVYSQRKEELARRGVTAAMSDWPAVESCVDKWRFYQLTNGRFPLPRTVLEPGDGVEFPCFVKPIRGKGGRGIALCRDRGELDHQLMLRDDLLIQEYLPGEEYSIDVMSDLEGKPLVAVPRTRIATKEGISVKGKVLHDPEVEDLCLELAATLGLKGPSCMQMKRDRAGRMRFVEVNPRMGGATIFATLAGVNFATVLLDLACGEKVEVPAFRELTVLRYYEEIVLDGKGS